MDAARKQPSKRRDSEIRRKLGLSRKQDSSDSSDSHSDKRKRIRRTLKVDQEESISREENFGRELVQVRTGNTPPRNQTGRRESYSNAHCKSNVPGGISLREGHISAKQNDNIAVAYHENSERHHIKLATNSTTCTYYNFHTKETYTGPTSDGIECYIAGTDQESVGLESDRSRVGGVTDVQQESNSGSTDDPNPRECKSTESRMEHMSLGLREINTEAFPCYTITDADRAVATDNTVASRCAQTSSSFSNSALKLNVNETATDNSPAQMNSHLVDGDAAEGGDSDQSDIITSEEDCTDDVIFVDRAVAIDKTVPSRYAQPSSSISSSALKLHVDGTATDNSTAQMNSLLVDGDAAGGEDSNQSNITIFEEDCTDDVPFVFEALKQFDLSMFESPETMKTLPKSLKEIARTCSTPKAFRLPKYTQNDIITIERETRGKQDNPKWIEFRTGCIEAEIFKAVATRKDQAVQRNPVRCDGETRELVNDVMNNMKKPTSPRKDTAEKEMIHIAKQIYTKERRCQCHSPLDISECGLYIHPEMIFIGASPSAQVSCKNCGDGLLQINCPKVKGWEKPTHQNTEYLVKTRSGKVELKTTHAVYIQIQTQLVVTGRPWCDFFSFTKAGHFRQRVRMSDTNTLQWQRFAEHVKDFFLTHVVPGLLHVGIAQSILNSNPTSSTSYHRPVSSSATCSTFECVPNNRSDTDSSIQPSGCARSTRTNTAEPQEASEGASNDEVLPDSLSDRARRCRSTGEAFSLPRYDQEDIDTIEAKTRGQSDNPLWFQYRIGCISASRIKDVVSLRGSRRRDPNVLVKTIMKYTVLNPNHPNLVWGRTMEPVARYVYLQVMKSKGHEEIEVKECGIFFHPEKTFIGASPDGLVSCKSGCNACKREDDRYGILEIKCPVSLKPGETPGPRNTGYIKESARDRNVLSTQHTYYHQVQTQLAVTGLPWCDFFVYNHYGKSFIQRIRPRPRQWNFDAIQAEQFFWKYIVPELVDRKLQNQMARDPVGHDSPERFEW
eukprot:XP_011679050.1 PREDICTED: uncharacterized protein LOC105445328 [Strongylocentrotus purpuratus]